MSDRLKQAAELMRERGIEMIGLVVTPDFLAQDTEAREADITAAVEAAITSVPPVFPAGLGDELPDPYNGARDS